MIPTVAQFEKAIRESGWTSLAEKAVEQAKALEPLAKLAQAVSFETAAYRPVGFYADPKTFRMFVAGDPLDAKAAAAVLREAGVDAGTIESPDIASLVKIAASQAVHTLGEWTNFFPGEYPGGVPNHASPVASMLTSGLLGAGLGWGAGWVGEKAMPSSWKRGKLRKTLGTIGALAGAVPGLVLGLHNAASGRPFNSVDLLKENPAPVAKKGAEAFCKEAFGGGIGMTWAEKPEPTPLDVNIDALGQTLWDSGAGLATSSMATSLARVASRMPGGSQEGWVTPEQMGRLALRMGGGYLSGALVGGVLGALTGLPDSAKADLRRTGALVGVVREVVPKLFFQE